MTTARGFARLQLDDVLPRLLSGCGRVLLAGAMGAGKSHLAARLGAGLAAAGRTIDCISADPGTPAFGLPGTVALGRWHGAGWQLQTLVPLCSLDAARFRLPLVEAVRRLSSQTTAETTLVDTAGVVRGAAGAELLAALVAAVRPQRVVVLARVPAQPPLAQELAALAVEVWLVAAAPAAQCPGPAARRRQRTALWDDYLRAASPATVDLRTVARLGTPPPLDVPTAWQGRQLALLDGARLLAMAEAQALESGVLTLRAPSFQGPVKQVLVRDAQRGADGLLGTAPRFARAVVRWVPPADIAPSAGARGPTPVADIGGVTATLVNGVFGDPLLHLRLRHRRRGLLFDLGESGRLPARLLHQVTDVFISHAHADHIGGFVWFLRARMGALPPCRLYGPPGLADNIDGFLRGLHWDRIGDHGPRFDVMEVHGDVGRRYRLQAGRAGARSGGAQALEAGLLLREPELAVRAVDLDHGGTRVLAFAVEQPCQINVRKERLAALGATPGPWLTELKRQRAAGNDTALIRLPDGSTRPVHALAAELLLTAPGRKIVYATDLSATPVNRDRLAGLARDAHTFFCEAAFLPADDAQARRTGHLTTSACAEIANAANVRHLIPFHFSARYENRMEQVYADLVAKCSRTVVPWPGG